jgi:hypothetical protein
MSKEEENLFKSAAWNIFNDEYEGSGIEENFGPELESDKIQVENTEVTELKSSAQTLLRLDIDRSGSMSGFTGAMQRALELVKESIFTSQEVNRIQMAKTLFAETVEPGGYVEPEKFDTSYSANSGCTKLYDSIIDSERRLRQYSADLIKNGVSVKAVLCILSDGLDNDSVASFEEAKDSIAKMQADDVTVCFIAFGSDQCQTLANQLGITNVVKTDATIHDLHKIMKFVSLDTVRRSQGNDK